MLLGHDPITGASLSCTVTVKLQLAVSPPVSVAVQFTVVVPTPKVDPLAGVQTTVAFGSETFGAKVTLLLHKPGLVERVRLPGHVMVGGVVSGSVIRTVFEIAVETFPAASFTQG